jgi:hypothetical protein
MTRKAFGAREHELRGGNDESLFPSPLGLTRWSMRTTGNRVLRITARYQPKDRASPGSLNGSNRSSICATNV